MGQSSPERRGGPARSDGGGAPDAGAAREYRAPPSALTGCHPPCRKEFQERDQRHAAKRGEQDGPSTGSGRTGKVLISKDQYFAEVPEIAWSFHIGGYQPAQKWLKDRRGRTLSYDDIGHYQRIVKILTETDRIMREINLPLDASSV